MTRQPGVRNYQRVAAATPTQVGNYRKRPTATSTQVKNYQKLATATPSQVGNYRIQIGNFLLSQQVQQMVWVDVPLVEWVDLPQAQVQQPKLQKARMPTNFRFQP